jgi:hypothetical protein
LQHERLFQNHTAPLRSPSTATPPQRLTDWSGAVKISPFWSRSQPRSGRRTVS